MNKIYMYLSLLLFSAGATPLHADTVSPYKQDFNRSLSTDNHHFAPSGWSHIVDSLEYDDVSYYVSYSYSSWAGVDGSGCLSVGSQDVSDYWGHATKHCHDALVTPPVAGKCSVRVKSSRYYSPESSTISFFKVKTNADGIFALGDSLAVDVPQLTNDEYATIQLPEAETGTRYAICGSQVYIDDFAADNAEVELKSGLTITDMTLYSTNGGWTDADADGNYTVTFNVNLRNTGDKQLDNSLEGYTLTLINMDKHVELGTFSIDKPLAIDENTIQQVSKTLNISDYPDVTTYGVRENISGTIGHTVTVKPYAYVSEFHFTESTDTKALGDTTLYDFGTSQNDVTFSFALRNYGAKPLPISSVSVPEGFTTDWNGAQTIPAHGRIDVKVTMSHEMQGAKSGYVSVKGDGVDFRMPVKGTTVSQDQLFYDFEDGKMPLATVYNDGMWGINAFPRVIGLKGNNYCLEGKSVTKPEKFITPLVEVKSGESLSFDAAQIGQDSYLNIYYSADRKNWTLVHSIIADSTITEGEHFSQKVVYEAWDGEKYEMTHFAYNNIPAGQWYIAFEGHCYIDNIAAYNRLGVAHDVSFSETVIPVTGMVNHTSTAKASVRNVNDRDEQKDGYKVIFYLDDVAVDTISESPLIKAGESKTFTAKFTPAQAGTYHAYAVFVAGDYRQVSDTTMMDIAEDNGFVDVAVGTASKLNNTVPVYTYDANSETETVYPAALLKDVPAGAEITKLTYRGFNSDKKNNFKRTLTVWMENTTDTVFGDDLALRPTANMTQVYQGEYTFPNVGTRDDAQDMIVLPLATPFKYDGQNLRITILSEGDGYCSTYYEVDDTYTQYAIGRHTDYTLANASLNKYSLPVVHLEVNPTVTAITGITQKGHARHTGVYDLTGRKVADSLQGLKSGIYIVNGKKVIK